MTTPLQVFHAVRAVARLGKAYSQFAQTRRHNTALPAIVPPVEVDDHIAALSYLEESPEGRAIRRAIIGDGPPDTSDPQIRAKLDLVAEEARHLWTRLELGARTELADEVRQARGSGAVAQLTGVAPDRGEDDADDVAIGVWYLTQWSDGHTANPYVRAGFVLVDIALEYAEADPALFAADAQGEKVIAAVTGSLREVLSPLTAMPGTDAAGLGVQAFAARSLAIVFRAGLQTLHDNPDLIADEAHLAELTQSAIGPLVQLASEHPDHMPSWRRIRDRILGPVVQNALRTVAARPDAYFGEDFADTKGLGAVSQGVLLAIAEKDLDEAFSVDGLGRIYAAALNVVADRPGLFLGSVGQGDGDAAGLAKSALTNIADALKDLPHPFKIATLRAEITVAALQGVANYAPVGGDGAVSPWGRVAVSAVKSFVEGMNAGLTADAARQAEFGTLVSRPFLAELARIVFTEAAQTPGMLAGEGANTEVKRIVATVCRLMCASQAGLLAPNQWRVVMSTLFAEAARNPGVLFSLDDADEAADGVASALLASLLTRAAASLDAPGGAGPRRRGAVMFGQTLLDAMIATIRAAAGNVVAAADQATPDRVIALADALIAEAEAGRVGAAEWSYLYRYWIAEVVANGLPADANTANLLAPLHDAPVIARA